MSEHDQEPVEDPDVEAHGMKEVIAAGASALVAAGAAGGVSPALANALSTEADAEPKPKADEANG